MFAKPRSLVAALVVGCALGASPGAARADTELTPLSGFGSNTFDAFIGWPTLFHAAAIGSTVVLARSGADESTTNYFRDHPSWGHAGIGGEILGYGAPTVGTALVYLVGRVSHNDKTTVLAYALLQTSILTFAAVTTGKLITGRERPDESEQENGTRNATQSFHFFTRGGLIDGWPSGHTAIITAFATTLATYYQSAAVAIVGLTTAVYTGFSMVTYKGGSEHYLSDVVAGFLIGVPIGWSVGRGFHQRYARENENASTWSLAPLVAGDARGLSVVGSF
ncbi:MAG: phosphatase PAP2 family protein [Polyangiales bacterium]